MKPNLVKEIIFFALFFCIIFISVRGTAVAHASNNSWFVWVAPLIATGVLVTVYKLGNVCNQGENFTKPASQSFRLNESDNDIPKKKDEDEIEEIKERVMDSSLAGCRADSFNLNNGLFEVTPAKMCDGGVYMRTSASPELQQMCDAFSPEQLAQVSCGTGFNGRPVHFDFSPESNDKWENERCYPQDFVSTCPL